MMKRKKPFLFNIINKYFWPVDKEERFNLENPNLPIDGFTVSEILSGQQRSGSGIPVSVSNATSLSAVYRCVAILAGIISYLPKKPYRDIDNGRELVKDHPTYLLLKRRMSRCATSPVFFERAIWHMVLWGDHLAEIIYNKKNQIDSFELIHPSTFKEVKEMNGNYYYCFTNRDPIKDEYIIHVPHLGENPMRGLGVIAKAREDMGLELARRNTGANFWNDGGRPEGLLIPSHKLSDHQVSSLKKSFKDAKKEGGTIVSPYGVSYQQLSMNPQDQEFIMSGNFSVATICRWFGVPLDKLSELSRATFSNIEHQAIAFLQDTIAPIVNKIEAEYTSKCYTLSSEMDMYMEMSMDAYQRSDSQAQAELMRAEIQNGTISPNEWRALKNRSSKEGGDDLYMQLNMAPLSKLEQIQLGNKTKSIVKNARQLVELAELEYKSNGNGKH